MFRYTILYVPDVTEAVSFYQRALGLALRKHDDEGGYAELETGDTRLAFLSYEQARSLLPDFREHRPDEPPPPIEIGFLVDDIVAAYDHAVAEGATPYAPPEHKPWGQTIAYIRDPHGVLIELAQRDAVDESPATDATDPLGAGEA